MAGFNCKSKIDGIIDPLERSLILSGDNRKELEKVIAHFQQDPDSLNSGRPLSSSAIWRIQNTSWGIGWTVWIPYFLIGPTGSGKKSFNCYVILYMTR